MTEAATKEAPEAPVEEASPPKTMMLGNSAQWSLAEHRRSHYVHTVPHTVTAQEVLQPQYFWNIAAKLNKGDIIECIDELLRWEVTLRVLGKDAELKLVRVSPITELTNHSAARNFLAKAMNWEEVTVKWRGPRAKWSVVRGSDVLADSFDTEDEASAWLKKKKGQMF